MHCVEDNLAIIRGGRESMATSVLAGTGNLLMSINGKPMKQQRFSKQVPSRTGDTRFSLLTALSLQAISRSQRGVEELLRETIKYLNPSRVSSPRNMEEALMTVPDLETVPYRLVKRTENYEIRQVESYLVAETTVPGRRGFDVFGSSEAFNTIASYLFGKNARKQEMAMTTPVFVEKADMTNPIVTQAQNNSGEWKMAFVMPSKYTEATLPEPKDSSVQIRRVPAALVAAVSFSGYVTDEEAKVREQQLRKSLEIDPDYRVKPSAVVTVAQYNPPFTPPPFRRNELLLEVENSPPVALLKE